MRHRLSAENDQQWNRMLASGLVSCPAGKLE